MVAGGGDTLGAASEVSRFETLATCSPGACPSAGSSFASAGGAGSVAGRGAGSGARGACRSAREGRGVISARFRVVGASSSAGPKSGSGSGTVRSGSALGIGAWGRDARGSVTGWGAGLASRGAGTTSGSSAEAGGTLSTRGPGAGICGGAGVGGRAATGGRGSDLGGSRTAPRLAELSRDLGPEVGDLSSGSAGLPRRAGSGSPASSTVIGSPRLTPIGSVYGRRNSTAATSATCRSSETPALHEIARRAGSAGSGLIEPDYSPQML